MEALKYTRKNSAGNDEICIGLRDESTSSINPIIDGYLCRGICHTNAQSISIVDVDIPLDLATGKLIE